MCTLLGKVQYFCMVLSFFIDAVHCLRLNYWLEWAYQLLLVRHFPFIFEEGAKRWP